MPDWVLYTVTFTLPGFNTFKLEGLELTAGFTATVNGEPRVGAISETATVTGQTPVVDVQNAPSTTVVPRQVLDVLPTGGEFQDIVTLIPGVSGNRGSDRDVGGQLGQTFGAMTIHGGSPRDQMFLLDGMTMDSGQIRGASNFQFSDGNYQEFVVDVGGQTAETPFGGIRIDMVPRDGSNEFKGTFFHRIFRTFEVVENTAVTPADYDPYCVTTPVDTRLPGGGGQQLCGFFDLKPNKVGITDPLLTSDSNYGRQKETWRGMDFTLDARLTNGLLVQSGISTGKSTSDTCAFNEHPNVSWVSTLGADLAAGQGGAYSLTGAEARISTTMCELETPFLTQAKVLGSYTLPWGGIRVSGTLSNYPGPSSWQTPSSRAPRWRSRWGGR